MCSAGKDFTDGFPSNLDIEGMWLANLSFAKGKFPQMFRVGQVTPLLKKPGTDIKDMLNFLLITNLNTKFDQSGSIPVFGVNVPFNTKLQILGVTLDCYLMTTSPASSVTTT